MDNKKFPEPKLEIDIFIKKYGRIIGRKIFYSLKDAREGIKELERELKKNKEEL